MKKIIYIFLGLFLFLIACTYREELPFGTIHPLGNSVLTIIEVSPSSAMVLTTSTKQFTAVGKDQYNFPINFPSPIQWSISGIGAINSSGLFTAGSTAGTGQVIASVGSIIGNASVSVVTQVPYYGIFTEDTDVIEGMKLGVNNPPDVDGGNYGAWGMWPDGNGVTWVGESTGAGEMKEGTIGFCVSYGGTADGYWGWANFSFGCTNNKKDKNAPIQEKDLSIFSSGKLEFWYKATNDFYIELEGPWGASPNPNTKKFAINRDWGYSLDGNWHFISENLSQFAWDGGNGVLFSQIVCPFKILVSEELTGKIYGALFVDDVKWKR